MLEALGFTPAPPPQPDPWAPGSDEGTVDLDYLFLDLQEQPEALLPESEATVEYLKALGVTMHDAGTEGGLDSGIPSAYTYFGQFVDHDMIQDIPPGGVPELNDPQLAPLSLADARLRVRNRRLAPVDLDSLYAGDAPRDPAAFGRMLLGPVTRTGRRPPGREGDDFFDLPRRPRSEEAEVDRAAMIGAPRNDENLMVAQLTVAFLRAHNRLVGLGATFDETASLLRRHYHWIILHDFLPRIADPAIVASTLERPRWYSQVTPRFFLPLELTAAVYRFGHSMVRSSYDFNLFHPQAGLAQLFTLNALRSGPSPDGGVGSLTLPEDWIIQWDRFLGPRAANRARRIDTRLVEPLFELEGPGGAPLTVENRLAVRNLLRGYQLRMPTGQAMAETLGLPALTPEEIEAVAANPAQLDVLRASGFSRRTPLWFYTLAEAAHSRNRQGTDHLGPVGSTLVAELLVGLVRKSLDSILAEPEWVPSLGDRPGRFDLPDLLRLAGVL